MKPENLDSCPSECACRSHGVDRRDFLKFVGLGATAISLSPWEAMAGPFTREDFEKLVPADKKLRPEWVQSLFERGTRTVYSGNDLDPIGMPIGGLCSGQVYLGGDGKLWHWDIFNRHVGTGSEHYAKPMKAVSPVDQGFAIRVTAGGQTQERALDRKHWREVSFIGEYPIGYVKYQDPACPVSLALEAFSPFIPLNTEDSSLPATILNYTITNNGQEEAEVELAGWLENAVCHFSGQARRGLRRNQIRRRPDFSFLAGSAEEAAPGEAPQRADVVFDDFERDNYGSWTATGTAFGSGPVEIAKIPDYQGDVGGHGKRVVNSHASAPGSEVGGRDAAKGTLTSRSFTIERNYITFLIGGGGHQGKTCMNLLVDGKPVQSAVGPSNNRMRPMSWDVRNWAGKSAQLQIVDDESGGWGNIGIDDIVFSDHPRVEPGPLTAESDFGTMGLALLSPQAGDTGTASLPDDSLPRGIFASPSPAQPSAKKPFAQKLVGALSRRVKLAPGQSAQVVFAVVWHFPNLKINRLPPGRHYGVRFDSAESVAAFIAGNYARLSTQTRLWHDTWYDSTLPYWFLDRTFLNVSILATSTCYRFATGRFYAWEGVGCCEGTCGHVWQYAHAMARLFPDLERTTREEVDFGLALKPDGAIFFRGEFNDIPAIDAQAGTILRALREHQMTTTNAFLKRNWDRIKRAVEWLIAKDGDGDGLIESNQHNTLDTDWFGPVAWLSGLYVAALMAAVEMAREMGDEAFAKRCQGIIEAGRKNLVAKLYTDGYFINRPDPKHLNAINSGSGCHIDQVMGQSWAWQVGLGRVFPEAETHSALESLWRFNFTPDVGPYRQKYKPGRWYAMPGEAGLLMCSFPRGDWDYDQAKGKGPDWAAGYFNECMNGFEYQAASHMIWEGMVQEGLAVTRAVHDRYHASRRNPWNEIECGDHYARSMASHGIFLAACGFQYYGPHSHLGFAPRLSPGNFRAPFTAAEGWGTFSQKWADNGCRAQLAIKWGRLQLKTLSLAGQDRRPLATVTVKLEGRSLPARLEQAGNKLSIQLDAPAEIQAGQTLEIEIV